MRDIHEEKQARKGKKGKRGKTVTLGELIAAAFDAVGNEVTAVRRLLTSRELATSAGRRIVLVP